eukprot:c18540_g1_i1.p1 GENE.c18540_g1_i1~~c18540_g1_i1.p1  ORF type:complete len:373 (-),score=49.49 c18540_g1_i1:972-2090(-)
MCDESDSTSTSRSESCLPVPERPPSVRAFSKRPSHAELWEQNLNFERIVQATTQLCPCSDKTHATSCPQSFKPHEVFQLRLCRKQMKPSEEYNARMRDMIGAKERLILASDSKPMLNVSGKLICIVGYCTILGLSEKSVRRLWRQVKNQGREVLHHGRPAISESEKDIPVKSVVAVDCLEWLRSWGSILGETDSTPKDYDLVLDPFDKTSVYSEYLHRFQWTHLATSNQRPCSYRLFVKIMKHWMKTERVRVRAKKNITTKCDVCEELKFKRRTCKTKDEYATLKKEASNHREYVMKLRCKYQQACERARHDDYFAVVAFDGSDQQSTHVPLHWTISQRGDCHRSTKTPALFNSWSQTSCDFTFSTRRLVME